MPRWVAYAIVSMIFAGFTSVIAKLGLTGISSDLGLAIRSCFVVVFVMIFAAVVVPASELRALTSGNVCWLGLSAVTTSASWVFYYKAVKLGNVSTVALIDKGSVVVAILLSILILHEVLTPAKMIGCALMLTGLGVIALN
jgi:bacterial/archaeal transporter family protein